MIHLILILVYQDVILNFQGCETCNKDNCLSCKKKFIMDTSGSKPECLLDFDRMPDDYCRISTHQLNVNIKKIKIIVILMFLILIMPYIIIII